MADNKPETNSSENNPSNGYSGTLMLVGEININNCTELVRNLIEIENQNFEKGVFEPIQLMINTAGGDLYATWMVCDVMSMLKTPIETIGLGQVASGGFMIFMNGTKGMRIASSNTQFMSHRYSMAFDASHSNIKSQQPELDRIHERIVNHYKKNTGLSERKIMNRLLTEHDVWLTAEECKKYKICDIVIDMNSQNNGVNIGKSHGKK